MPTTPRTIVMVFPGKGTDLKGDVRKNAKCLVTYGEIRSRFKEFKVFQVSQDTIILKKTGP